VEPNGEVGTRFDQSGTDIRLNLDHAAIVGWRGTVGVQFRGTDFLAEGEETYVPPTPTRNVGIFAVEERAFRPCDARTWRAPRATGSEGIGDADYTDYLFASPTDEIEDGLPVVRLAKADARFTGIEAEWELPPLALGGGNLSTRRLADYTRGKLDSGGDLPQIPPLRAGAGWRYARGTVSPLKEFAPLPGRSHGFGLRFEF
jgi:hypothetical protein